MRAADSPADSIEELKPRSLLILLFLLLPSALYLRHHQDLPQFGDFRDDGLYFVSAKSLADGGGYRVESLPGEPPQTKYPPLYPLLLSIAWRIDPVFPRNLPIAAWISWLAFPAILVQLAAYYPRLGITGWRTWVLLCLIAMNPYAIFFSSQLLTELSFLALILSTMLLVEHAVKPGAAKTWALAAGVMGGLAFLTRSAGIAMLAAALVYFWMRRDRTKIGAPGGSAAGYWPGWYFAAAAFPFVAGWTLWTQLHRVSSSDAVRLFYTDYLGYEFYNVSLRHAPLLLWKNLDGLLWGLGSLVQPKVTDSELLKIAAFLIAAAMISGVVRMVRRGQGVLYTLFAAGSGAILLVWHYPPNERLLLPIFPLALAGLLTEVEHFAAMLRTGLHHADRSQRAAAGALSTVAILTFAGSIAMQIYVAASYMPENAHERRLVQVDRVASYGWILGHVPREASILADDEAAVFLYTGRHATGRPVPPLLWYQEDRAHIVEWIGNPGPLRARAWAGVPGFFRRGRRARNHRCG